MVVINAATSPRKCYWCGSLEAFKCTCGYFTCADCKLFPTEQGCNHKKHISVESDWWQIQDS